MNYTRRPNRPDSDVYREMRRQGLRRARGSGGAMMNPKVLMGVTAVVLVLVVWLMWK